MSGTGAGGAAAEPERAAPRGVARGPSVLHLWILLLAAVSFLCGLAAGRLEALRAAEVDRGPFADYRLGLEREFDLAEEPLRAEALRELIEEYDRKLNAVKERHLQDYWSSIEPELSALGAEYGGKIRDTIIPPSRRAEFDRLSRAIPIAPTETQ